jgi:hypothetical protein
VTGHATIPGVTMRRSDRSSQVRRRPPSSGRPAPPKIKLKPVSSQRITTRRQLPPRASLPLPARIILLAAVGALGVVVLFAWTGGIGKMVSAFGSSLSAALGNVALTSTPAPSVAAISRSPLIAAPAEPYTNQAKVDLGVTVPNAMVGQAGVKVRIYVALKGQAAAPIKDVPVGATPKIVIPVDLTDGQNDFTATVISAGGESEASPVVTYILDTAPPPITLTSPKDKATVNLATTDLVGKTQARSRLLARNEANGSSITATAGADGAFTMTLPLQTGSNVIRITATDPAGNGAELVITLVRGTGVLKATLAASGYRFVTTALPTDITLTATVTDPDGQPLKGAKVTFSLTIPGVPAIQQPDVVTGADGKATFKTSIPKSATVGQGQLSILVNTTQFGTATDRSAITIAAQ